MLAASASSCSTLRRASVSRNRQAFSNATAACATSAAPNSPLDASYASVPARGPSATNPLTAADAIGSRNTAPASRSARASSHSGSRSTSTASGRSASQRLPPPRLGEREAALAHDGRVPLHPGRDQVTPDRPSAGQRQREQARDLVRLLRSREAAHQIEERPQFLDLLPQLPRQALDLGMGRGVRDGARPHPEQRLEERPFLVEAPGRRVGEGEEARWMLGRADRHDVRETGAGRRARRRRGRPRAGERPGRAQRASPRPGPPR